MQTDCLLKIQHLRKILMSRSNYWLSFRNFLGEGGKSIDMLISLLFSDQIFLGGKIPAPCGRKPDQRGWGWCYPNKISIACGKLLEKESGKRQGT